MTRAESCRKGDPLWLRWVGLLAFSWFTGWLLAQPAVAQTASTPAQSTCGPGVATGILVYVYPGFGVPSPGCAQLDSTCFTLDKTTTPPTIRNTCSAKGPTFVYGETPAGLINGLNLIFTLAASPSPPASLELIRNGFVLTPGLDFTLIGATITFVALGTPQPGDSLFAKSYTK
jgi:hypothetical protein